MFEGFASPARSRRGVGRWRGQPERLAGLVRAVLWALVGGAVAIAALAVGFDAPVTAGLAAANAVCHAGLLCLLRRGHPTLVGVAANAILLATAITFMLIGSGIHDVAIVLLPVLLVAGSVMLDRIPFIGLVVLTVLAVIGVGLVERAGLVPRALPGPGDPTDLAATAVILIGAGAVIYLLIDRLYYSFGQVAASESRYREIFNATNEAIFVHDVRTGAILEVNDPMLALYGYSREEALRCTVGQLSAVGTEEGQRQALVRIERAAAEGPQIFEWHARRKDGTDFWAEVTLRASEIGGQGRVLAVVRDIDKRRRSREQHRQAERMEAVGQLAGGVAHDFNNQLTGIMGFADLIRSRTGSDPAICQYADGILKAAGRAADVTSQLLAFARKGRGTDASVDLHAVVAEVVGLLKHSIDRRIRIRAELEAPRHVTRGDASQLVNAVLNLGLNARDAMPEGGELTFRTETLEVTDDAELAAGSYVRVQVADTGAGMSDATRAQMFEPFFTTKPAGTGMGLAAVYGTVRTHRGRIDVQSAIGEGTRVSMLLPAERDDSTLVGEAQAASVRRERLGVLLIEDEPTVAEAGRLMLESLGHGVRVVGDAEAGVAAYRASPSTFDLVFMDMTTPRLSAEEALRQLLEINADVRVVLCSGHAAGAETQRLLNGGAAAFLQKPYRLEQLEAALRRR